MQNFDTSSANQHTQWDYGGQVISSYSFQMHELPKLLEMKSDTLHTSLVMSTAKKRGLQFILLHHFVGLI